MACDQPRCPRCGRFLKDRGSYFADTSEWDEWWVCSRVECEQAQKEAEARYWESVDIELMRQAAETAALT